MYPTYDFAHCICDSLENITHSLCTLEFEIRRELYYWILNELDMYKPIVYEFSRLNIENQILSKRNLKKLVDTQKVAGWNDPRLLTLVGLRKRGYTPSSLNQFIDMISVSRTGNENFISMQQLESCIRKELDENAPRVMVVFDPVELRIDGDLPGEVEVPIHPKKKELGCRKIKLSKTIFIERRDVRLEDEEGYYGLAPKKRINLKYLGVIECTSIETDE